MATVYDLERKIYARDFDIEEIDGDIEFVEDQFDAFRKYFNAVYEHVMGSESARLRLAAGRYDTAMYQEKIMTLDSNRRQCHDRAVDACRIINRMCKLYEVPALCPQTEDRHEIAEFIGKYMYSVYQQGIETSKTIGAFL